LYAIAHSAIPDGRLQELQLLFGRLVPELALDIEQTTAAKTVHEAGSDVSFFFVG
jgi:hypothetical protein